jgi:hypothetical protein
MVKEFMMKNLAGCFRVAPAGESSGDIPAKVRTRVYFRFRPLSSQGSPLAA